MTRPTAVAVVMLVTLLTMSACTSSGPLSMRGEPAAVCVPAGEDALAVIALDSVSNGGDVGLEIESVSVRDGNGLEVTGAAILPDGLEGFRGAATGGSEGPQSQDFVELGAGGIATVQVTLRLTDIGTTGKAPGLRIKYRTVGGMASSSADTDTSVEVVPPGAVCG